MNRLAISIILLIIIVIVSVATTMDIHFAVTDLEQQLLELKEAEDYQLAIDTSTKLTDSWTSHEDRLVLYVNHQTLDQLTIALAEVPALVQFQETAFLHSKIDAILELLDDLWKSTVPNYRNLLFIQ